MTTSIKVTKLESERQEIKEKFVHPIINLLCVNFMSKIRLKTTFEPEKMSERVNYYTKQRKIFPLISLIGATSSFNKKLLEWI